MGYGAPEAGFYSFLSSQVSRRGRIDRQPLSNAIGKEAVEGLSSAELTPSTALLRLRYLK
jgi:hypothetical protein